MLRRFIWLLCLVPSLLFAQDRISGEWLVTYRIQDVNYYHDLSLTDNNGKLSGNFNGESLEGTIYGNAIHIVGKSKSGKTTEYAGTLSADGTLSFQRTVPADEGKYTARRVPQRRPGPPQRHEFTPTTYHRSYSALTPPVLTVWPGDTIHTSTVDSGGTDGHGVNHGPGGNPLTGPFYIETAMPGDVLAIHFNRIRSNRDQAVTSGLLVPRVLNPGLAAAVEAQHRMAGVIWHLDPEHGVATLMNPGEHLKNFSVPLRPMLGSIGVAPRGTPSPAGDSGPFGGNMDVNEIVEGATLYLPVFEPGALLYMGDAHALMGDGEITGSGLETSMDVEFTVDLVHKPIVGPMVESDTHLIAIGFGGSLDEAIRSATFALVHWLEVEYKLTLPEVIQVLGSAVEYSVGEVADRNAGVLAKINKKYLAEFTADKSSSTVTPASSQAAKVISVWGGAREAIALKSDGTVWTWGHNGAGQLGNGNNIYEPTPVQVLGKNGIGTLGSVIAIAGGEAHNIALTSDGNVWQWGGLGNGGKSNYPVQVQGLSSITSVASRAYATLAVKTDGTVWGWGMNCHGALGVEAPRVIADPVQIKGVTNPIMVSAGYCFGIALLQDHTVVAWGDSRELGTGSKTDSYTPVAVQGLKDVVSISAGWMHAMAVKSDGTVWTWGENHWGGAYPGDGKLGNGTTAGQLIPAKVPGLTNVIQASGGDDFSAVLKSDETVWTFGANGAGQLGNGDPNLVQQLLPVQVVGLKNITYITARDFHAQAIQSDGTVWSWGSGVQGELGVPCKALSVAEQFELTGAGDRSPQPPNCTNSNIPVKVQWP